MAAKHLTQGTTAGLGREEVVRWYDRRRRLKKTLAMYATMVAVSTCAIFLLEHATLAGAFRTALVAAIGKTFAANWVSSIFE